MIILDFMSIRNSRVQFYMPLFRVFTFFLNLPITMTDFRFKEKLISGMHILHGIIHTARTGSVYVTIAVTIERFFAVVHPTKEFKMKLLLLPFAIIFAVLYNIPKVNQEQLNQL